MIWSTSYYHVILLVYRSWPHLLFTVASVHRRQVLLKLHRHTQSLASKSPTCPSHLQPVRRAKSCLDLLHLDHMTQCHVSYAMSSSIITCASFSTSPSHFHLHDICCSQTCTCGLITYVSHINIISPPKVVTQLPKPNKDLSVPAVTAGRCCLVRAAWHRDGIWPDRGDRCPLGPLQGQCGVLTPVRASTLGWVRPLLVPPRGQDGGEVVNFLCVMRLSQKGEVVANPSLGVRPGSPSLARPRSFGLLLADILWAAWPAN
jgi:hypothetical protein